MVATVSLRAIAARTDLGLRLLAGEFGDRMVRWVHICELPDPALYLNGLELLLTAGVDFPVGDAEIDHYVARLVEADTAALGFGVTPVYDEVPPSLVDSCRRHGLPLLEVSERVSFLYISQTVSLMLAAIEREGSRRLSTAQRVLTRAAARPDGIEAVVRRLAGQLHGWTVLTDAAGHRIAGAEPPAELADEVAGLTSLVRALDGPSSATTHRGEIQIVVQRYDSGAVLIAGRSVAFGPSDRAVLSVGGALLTLLTSTRWQLSADTTAALLTVLSGGACGPADELLAAIVDRRPGTTWRVVRALRKGKPGSPTEIANQLGTPLAASAVDGGVLAVVPSSSPVALTGPWLCATSAAVALPELASAARQAERLLAEAQLDGRSRVADAVPNLDGLVVTAEAESFARNQLGQLLGAPELLETLRSWLAHSGNWEATAEALGVHRNTVRHRLTRTTTLLDRDLADPDTRAELWLALRWLPRG